MWTFDTAREFLCLKHQEVHILQVSSVSDDYDVWTIYAKAVLAEMLRQDMKWGANRIQSPETWALILGDKGGEVCRVALENDPDNYYDEITQVAAVAIQAAHLHHLAREKQIAFRE